MANITEVELGNGVYNIKDPIASTTLLMKKTIRIPAGLTTNMDVFFDIDYDDFYVWFNDEGNVYNDGESVTWFYTHGYEAGSVAVYKGSPVRIETKESRIRFYPARMQKDLSGDVIGGDIIFYFMPRAMYEMYSIHNIEYANKYFTFNISIPHGMTDEYINTGVSLPSSLSGISISSYIVYYEAQDDVYNGKVRLDAAGYTDTVYIYKNHGPEVYNSIPRWVRVYKSDAAKTGSTVNGGVVTLYCKPVISMTDQVLSHPFLYNPVIDGKEFDSYFTGGVPTYYADHMANKMKSIRDNMMDVGKNGETFVFITDLHWEVNDKNSPALVGYLMNNLNIDALLCGGDLINQGLREPMIETMRDCISKFNAYRVPMPCAFGNHDSNWNDYDGQREHPERRFDTNDQYALMQKQSEKVVTYISADAWNFYMDKPETKTRFIVLDTGEGGAFSQYSDVISCLNNTPSGYHIVIMAHWLYEGSKTTACANIESLIDAYNSRGSGTVAGNAYDFSAASGEIYLLLGGHYHNDASWTTNAGVPVVLTDTDSSRSNNTSYPYATGTITEQAFDVITVDYQSKSVKAVRVGRGADRSWTR